MTRRRTPTRQLPPLLPLLLLLLLPHHPTHALRRPFSPHNEDRRSLLLTPEQTKQQNTHFHHFASGTRTLAADATNADEHLITNLPGLAADAFPTRQWAGLLTVDEPNQGKFFYWFVEAAKDATEKPLLIWLNGGPGCSSMDGFFLENGPFKVQEDLTLKVHPHSWHNAANVLYIDQPVGTGFSFTGKKKYCDNDECINEHMYTFLQAFFKLHKWLLKEGTTTRPVFFSGESQAGHYIPSMVDYILLQNNAPPAAGLATIDVQGMAIGNGWFDPPNQYDVSDLAHGVGMISTGQYHTLQKKNEDCLNNLNQGRFFSPVCFSLLDEVVAATGTDKTGFISLYDYRLYDNPGDRTFPPGHKTVETYMNQDSVKAALHADESPMIFQECTDPPYDHLKMQDGLGVMPQVKRILESGKVRALFFNGAYDVICNHVGNEKALQLLEWTGQDAYHKAARGVWLPPGGDGGAQPGGYAKSSGALTFLVVVGAGHMVPLDVPVAALDMIRRLLENKGFVDRPQKIAMTVVPPGGPAAASSAAGGGDGATTVQTKPPGIPTLKSVKSLGGGAVELVIDPPTDKGTAGGAAAAANAQDGEVDMWYTILVNPGGSLIVPTHTQDDDTSPFKLADLKEGIAYTFQAVANTVDGASKPSYPQKLTLGCEGEADTCQHGLCGFDAEGQDKRCFCYQGWDGKMCEVAASAGGATAPAKGGGGGGDKQVLGLGGRVTFVVDQSCTGEEVEGCALRFTVPLHQFYGGEVKEEGKEWKPLEGEEETKAFEGMLRRDLAYAMGVEKNQVVLRSLHPFNSTATTTSSSSSIVDDDDKASSSSSSSSSSLPMALTFDLLSSPDPTTTVQLFTSLYSNPTGALRRGLITSNFDISQDAHILLLTPNTPLADLPSTGSVIVDTHTHTAKRSLTLSLVGMMMLGMVLLVVVKYTRRKASVGGGGGGRRGNVSVGVGVVGGGGVGGGGGRVRRRSDVSGGMGMEDDIVLDGSDEEVEIMEVRASTDSQGSRGGVLGLGGGGGGGSGGSISRLAGGLGIGSGGGGSRTVPVDDGASERLV